MRFLKRLALLGALCAAAPACSSDATGTNNTTTPPNLVGTWHATKFEFVSVANSATKDNFAATDNTITLTIGATNMVMAKSTGAMLTGTYTETATTVVFSGTDAGGHPETLSFALSVSGTTLNLSGASTTHDFNGTGSTASTFSIIATKQ